MRVRTEYTVLPCCAVFSVSASITHADDARSVCVLGNPVLAGCLGGSRLVLADRPRLAASCWNGPLGSRLGEVLTTHSSAGHSVARAHHSPLPLLRNSWDAQHSALAKHASLPSPPPPLPILSASPLCISNLHSAHSNPIHSTQIRSTLRHLPILLLHSAAAAAPLPFQPSHFGPSLILDRHRHLAEPHMLPALFGAIHMTIHPFHSFRLTFDLLSTSLLITCPPNNSLNSLHSLVRRRCRSHSRFILNDLSVWRKTNPQLTMRGCRRYISTRLEQSNAIQRLTQPKNAWQHVQPTARLLSGDQDRLQLLFAQQQEIQAEIARLLPSEPHQHHRTPIHKQQSQRRHAPRSMSSSGAITTMARTPSVGQFSCPIPDQL